MNPFTENQTRNGQIPQSHQPSGSPMNQMANMAGMYKDFQTFMQNFKGNPEQQVKQMLSSGNISNERFNEAVAWANQMKQFFGM